MTFFTKNILCMCTIFLINIQTSNLRLLYLKSAAFNIKRTLSQMDNPIVQTKYGKLKGKIGYDYKGGKYYSFQGIPYAKPPVGELRFKSPLPPEKWEGVRDATKLGNECLSIDFVDKQKIFGSEDCLFLNVYTPNIPKNEDRPNLRPVMFWIHGGGFHCGSGNTNLFGPGHLITGDVVLVTINYRLGILGFLSLEDPSLEVPGNAAMKDMVQALKWVKDNIENFGGDSKNVTIFGESVGGASVHFLLCSPMAKGLFHRGIIQSGCAFNPWACSKNISEELCKILKLNTTNEKDLLDHLRKIPAEKFIEIQKEIKATLTKSSGCDEMRTFRVVLEKPSSTEPDFLTKHPWEIIASGNYNKVPLMIGYANREGLLTEVGDIREFGSLRVPSDLTSRIPYFYNIPKGSDLAKTVAKEIKKFYFGNKEPSEETADEFLKLETDVGFVRGIYVAMRQLLSNLNLQIYLYRFSADTELNVIKKLANIKRAGTCHSDLVGYLFTTDYTNKFDENSEEGKIVNRLITMWTNFAKTSNPNSDELKITWLPVEKDCYNYLDIGKELIPGRNPEEDRMKFWDGIANNPAINSHF